VFGGECKKGEEWLVLNDEEICTWDFSFCLVPFFRSLLLRSRVWAAGMAAAVPLVKLDTATFADRLFWVYAGAISTA